MFARHDFHREAAGDRFGYSVSGAGDVDNDGYANLIVGAFTNHAAGFAAGRAYVYSGQTGALMGTSTGEAAFDEFGYSVSGAGDVNNDGYADLIVGARYNNAGGDQAGRAYLFLGTHDDSPPSITCPENISVSSFSELPDCNPSLAFCLRRVWR